MSDSPRHDFRFSRLMLGTVQFGMPYGVANRTGQPSYREVLAIVETAVAGGVNCFDTAAAYGTSEDIIGCVLQELGLSNDVIVVTKVRALLPEELKDPAHATRAIRQSVMESRRRLRLEQLPIVLFHREADAAYLDVLADLRAEGCIRSFGVSCDHRPDQAARFLADNQVSAVQLPGNVLDRRHQLGEIFQTASSRNVAVFTRSVYLQGLLTMPEVEIPTTLRGLIPARQRLQRIAEEASMSLAELALRYMLSQRGVTSVLTGVETVKQMKHNLEFFGRGPLEADLLSRIDLDAPILSDRLLTPGVWPMLKEEEAQ